MRTMRKRMEWWRQEPMAQPMAVHRPDPRARFGRHSFPAAAPAQSLDVAFVRRQTSTHRDCTPGLSPVRPPPGAPPGAPSPGAPSPGAAISGMHGTHETHGMTNRLAAEAYHHRRRRWRDPRRRSRTTQRHYCSGCFPPRSPSPSPSPSLCPPRSLLPLLMMLFRRWLLLLPVVQRMRRTTRTTRPMRTTRTTRTMMRRRRSGHPS